MAGGPESEDPEIDVRARMAADPQIIWKSLFRHYRPTKPIIAAVEGVAIAGGPEILQAPEIRRGGGGDPAPFARVGRHGARPGAAPGGELRPGRLRQPGREGRPARLRGETQAR